MSVNFDRFVQAASGRKRRSTGPAGPDGGRDRGVWGRDRGVEVGQRGGDVLNKTHRFRRYMLEKFGRFSSKKKRYLVPVGKIR